MTTEQALEQITLLYMQKYNYQQRGYSVYKDYFLPFSVKYNGHSMSGYVFAAHEFNPGSYPYLDKIYIYLNKTRQIYLLMDVGAILDNYMAQQIYGLTKRTQYIYVKTLHSTYRIDLVYFFDMLFTKTAIGKTIVTPDDFSKFENLFLITPTSDKSFVFETKPSVKVLDMLKFPPFEKLYKYFCVTHLGEGYSPYACQITFDEWTVTSYGGRTTLTSDTVWEKRDIIIDAYYRVVKDCPVLKSYAPRIADKFYIRKM